MTAERVPAATRANRATTGMRRAAGAEELDLPLPRDPNPRRGRHDGDDRRDRYGRRPDREDRSARSGRGAAARTAVAERPSRAGATGATATATATVTATKPATKSARAAESRGRLRVAPPEPVAAPRTPFVLLVLTLVAGGIVGLLVLNTAINADAFKITALKDQQNQLDTQEQQLNQELAELQSPGNLQAAATRLGLVPAGTPAYIQLPNGRILNVPQPAGSDSSGE